MNKLKYFAIVSTGLCAVILLFIVAYEEYLCKYLSINFELIGIMLLILSGTVSICVWAAWFGMKFMNMSPYKVIGGLSLLGLVGSVIFALYDILTSTGWFAGLTGFIILVYVTPAFGVVFIGDIIVFVIKRKKQSKQSL